MLFDEQKFAHFSRVMDASVNDGPVSVRALDVSYQQPMSTSVGTGATEVVEGAMVLTTLGRFNVLVVLDVYGGTVELDDVDVLEVLLEVSVLELFMLDEVVLDEDDFEVLVEAGLEVDEEVTEDTTLRTGNEIDADLVDEIDVGIEVGIEIELDRVVGTAVDSVTAALLT